MSEENKIEFTTRGKKQIKDILYNEVKSYVNLIMEPMIEERIDRAIMNKIQNKDLDLIIASKVERVVREVYWKTIEEMLRKADFQEKLKEEIIRYLHDTWANGQIPFDIQLNKALMKALKELIK
jgi:signal recognition particle GTPase